MDGLIAWLIMCERQVFVLDHMLKARESTILVLFIVLKLLSILTLICRFIVMQNRVMKYMTRIGQNTGTLKTSKNVHMTPISVLLVIAYQNLNSGNRRINGRNSSFERVGSSGP